jgi:hypothetical protein
MWWHNWRYLTHLKDEALSPQAYRIERLPIAGASEAVKNQAADSVARLINARKEVSEACALLRDWYAAELGITKPSQVLLEPFNLAPNEYVEQIRRARGARKPLSASAVHAIRQEHAQTVQPLQAALREAERLEWRLSDLVNEAYGLTPDEVRLMWATAPPRMPLMPEAGAPEQDEDEAAE